MMKCCGVQASFSVHVYVPESYVQSATGKLRKYFVLEWGCLGAGGTIRLGTTKVELECMSNYEQAEMKEYMAAPLGFHLISSSFDSSTHGAWTG